jgi:hypothetical protein
MDRRQNLLKTKNLSDLPPGWHSDGGGLYLVVSDTGHRVWGYSGLDLLTLSFSLFDPSLPSGGKLCCDAQHTPLVQQRGRVQPQVT